MLKLWKVLINFSNILYMMYKLLVICLFFNLLIIINSCPGGTKKMTCDEYQYKPYEDRSNILSIIPDTQKIGHLSLTGTHNSISYTTPNPQSQTQELNITEQLNAGVRVLDIGVRTILNYFTVYSRSVSMHRIFSDVIHWVNKFLDIHPREFVILILRQEYKSPQDDLHPPNCKILDLYLSENVGWRLSRNWTLNDSIDKVRGKILLTTNDISFIDCIFELFSRCSYFRDKDSSGYDNQLSIIDNKWNKYLKFVEKSINQDYSCYIYDMSIYDEKYYSGGAAKYAGYSFNDQCIEPLNNKLHRLYPGSNPLTMTIIIVDYVTQEVIDHVHEINHIKIKDNKI